MPNGPGHVAIGRWNTLVSADESLDREAEFERLVLPYRSQMMRAVWRVTRDPDLAEEAFQDALTTLWRKLPLVARHPNPEALVLRICLDAACDQLRAHRRRRRDVPLDEAALVSAHTTDEALERAAVVEPIVAALGRLKARQASAILLRAVHEASYRAIAEALGCSEVTARVHVMRAREKLRRWLAPLRTGDSP